MNVVAKYDSLHSLTQEMPIYLEEVLDNPTNDSHKQMRENRTWDIISMFTGSFALGTFSSTWNQTGFASALFFVAFICSELSDEVKHINEGVDVAGRLCQ